ncbi:MAG: C4-dicarboxylate ABC transporter, partial [Gallionellales bacterium RBG_16_56_9]
MNPLFRLLGNGLRHFNRWMAILSAILIAVATLVLVYEVVTRYFLRVTNDWVIELCVFLLIAATFLSAAHTQAERGHVGIEVLDEVMSPYWNRIRSLAGDFLSLVVVAFIANNAWRYTYNAYDQGWETGSTWAPALWIPYFFMAFGLTTLALQIVLQ